MTKAKLDAYRKVLDAMAKRVTGTAAGLEEGARMTTGGDADGGLSGTPMHLGDLGTEAYMQELNATLLENEEHILVEVTDALARIDNGTFGRCEGCGETILPARLDTLPYTRYCTPCSAKAQDGAAVNLNVGRSYGRAGVMNPRADAGTPGMAGSDEEPKPFTDRIVRLPYADADVHAAGTPGGGTAVGGLAGTNVGEGDPNNADLEGAMGSGNYDVDLDADDDDQPYAGPSGGAVGGTPANKRAVGGKKKGGTKPRTED